MAGDSDRERFVVRHSNWLNPDDWCRFIHFDGFTQDWAELDLNDDDLRALQIEIMVAPTRWPVVPGTGSLRKMRFAPPSSRAGKRGGVRVLYASFPGHSIVVLAAAYSKKDAVDLSPAQKKAFKIVLAEIARALDRP